MESSINDVTVLEREDVYYFMTVIKSVRMEGGGQKLCDDPFEDYKKKKITFCECELSLKYKTNTSKEVTNYFQVMVLMYP